MVRKYSGSQHFQKHLQQVVQRFAGSVPRESTTMTLQVFHCALIVLLENILSLVKARALIVILALGVLKEVEVVSLAELENSERLESHKPLLKTIVVCALLVGTEH